MYIVILAGGSGTRFWPLSRTKLPKQLISITGEKTMLQQTIERVIPLNPKRVLIVTNHLQAEESAKQANLFKGQVAIDIISEPASKNTAPAIALAAKIISEHDPKASMVVLPADHVIRNGEEFCSVIKSAIHAASNGYLVTIGLLPTRAETGYGYIEADTDMRGTPPYPVKRFVEKPCREKAEEYLSSKNFFWNSGMFVWRSDIILEEMKHHTPLIFNSFSSLKFNADIWELSDLNKQVEAIYSNLPNISIDYAIMEKSDKVQVIPTDIGWSDVGSFSALPEVSEVDENGTVAIKTAEHIAIDSKGCIIYGENKAVATIGVDNLVIVSTPDAILICNKDRSQDVKTVVEKLKERYR